MRLSVLLIFFLPFQLSAQFASFRIDAYHMPGIGSAEKMVVIEMPYAAYSITRITGDTAGLRNAGDIMLDVVYTDYPATATLIELNNNRVQSLLKHFPFLDQQKLTINYHRQLKGAEKENAMTMFHGLVLQYRPKQNEATMKQDWKKLNEMINPVSIHSSENEQEHNHFHTTAQMNDRKNEKIIKKMDPLPYAITPYEIEKRKEKISPSDSILIIKPSEALTQGLISREWYKMYKKEEFVKLYFHTRTTKKTVHSNSENIPIKYSQKDFRLSDTMMLNIFKRNQFTNTAIVGDVTGSMYPYTAQLLVWLQLHPLEKFTTRFIFFNDGDNMPDRLKRNGSTGGIYARQCKSHEEVREMIQMVMMKGGGGDRAENNMEALLLAEREFPGCEYYVMIADNWAPIRDKDLIAQLHKPVRIILCGVFNDNINVDYLNLARATGGSVHVMEKDIHDLSRTREGEVIQIGRKSFRIQNGRFHLVNEMEVNK